MSLFASCQDLFFPPRCQSCSAPLPAAGSQLLCLPCIQQVTPVTSPLCTCCGTPFPAGEDHLCGECLKHTFAFTFAHSSFYYQEPISTLLRQFKFNGNLAALNSLVSLINQDDISRLFTYPDILIPVPLHISRLRMRGFNQSLMLGRHCMPAWQHKLRPDLLVRHRATITQTSLSGKTRRNNLHNAFTAGDKQAITGSRILLIDDVFTTGATLHECARTLIKAGAGEVEAFTLSRTLPAKRTPHAK